jgi:hypothetical protein
MTDAAFDLNAAVLDNSNLKSAAPPSQEHTPAEEKKRTDRRRPSIAARQRKVIATRAEPVPISKDKAVQRYQYWGLISALVVLELVWVGLWVLNGYLSILSLNQWIGMAVVPAAIVHLGISLCEQHLPRVKAMVLRHKMVEIWKVLRWIIWPVLFLVTLFDVVSSAAGIQWGAATRGMAYQGYVVILFTLLGAFIALASERLIVLTGVIIVRLVKR